MISPARIPRQQEPISVSMRFQQRDAEILQAIYTYDGVLARRHVKRIFWPQTSKQAMERRLSLLHKNGYLNLPNQEQRRIKPIPEPIVWLGWHGMVFLAGLYGEFIEPPANLGENQLRLLDRRLRSHGIRWQREPRWSQLAHDLAVIDIRLSIEEAIQKQPTLNLETWIPEGVFLSQMDVVTFSYKRKDGLVRKAKKGVRPDGYFAIIDSKRQAKGLPAKARFLLELDNSTHPHERFSRDKIAAGLAYIKSGAYKERFGYNSGTWLVVCKSLQRMTNLKRQAEKVVGSGEASICFTTIDLITSDSFLTAPIWHRCGDEFPKPLLCDESR